MKGRTVHSYLPDSKSNYISRFYKRKISLRRVLERMRYLYRVFH